MWMGEFSWAQACGHACHLLLSAFDHGCDVIGCLDFLPWLLYNDRLRLYTEINVFTPKFTAMERKLGYHNGALGLTLRQLFPEKWPGLIVLYSQLWEPQFTFLLGSLFSPGVSIRIGPWAVKISECWGVAIQETVVKAGAGSAGRVGRIKKGTSFTYSMFYGRGHLKLSSQGNSDYLLKHSWVTLIKL